MIQEIRRLMLKWAKEVVNKEKMDRRELTQAVGKQPQHQQSIGEGENI
jgi:hypothetical protein